MTMDYTTLPNIATEQLTALRNPTDQFDRHHGGHVHGFDSQKEKSNYQKIQFRQSTKNDPRKYRGQIFRYQRKKRIRQIEKITLGKLKRTVTTSKLQIVNQLGVHHYQRTRRCFVKNQNW